MVIGPLAAAFEPGQGLTQAGVVAHGPAAQEVEQAPLHLGSGGLGVGHAQDGLGPGAGQQQTRHPVDQGLGLARACIGGDEGRKPRIRGQALRVLAHPPSSSPLVDHSKTRARWS